MEASFRRFAGNTRDLSADADHSRSGVGELLHWFRAHGPLLSRIACSHRTDNTAVDQTEARRKDAIRPANGEDPSKAPVHER
jgi:hypothetical protein